MSELYNKWIPKKQSTKNKTPSLTIGMVYKVQDVTGVLISEDNVCITLRDSSNVLFTLPKKNVKFIG